jgi:hypothetical protein
MRLTFLEAEVPLTKSYEKKQDGSYLGGSYPGVRNFTSHVEEVEDCKTFAKVLKQASSSGKCLLTNSLTKKIKNESRAKLSDQDELREWIVLDVDGIDGVTTPEAFVKQVLPSPFHDVSYIIQHSPSSGIKSGVRCHIFFLLEDAVDVKSVSAWLKYSNLATQQLSDQITLSSNALALSLKLDWVANNNGRIIYITPPECIGFDDPVTERFELVEKKHDRLSFNFAAIGEAQMRTKYRAKLDELRKAAGLAVHKVKDIYEYRNGKEYVADKVVECARITGAIPDNDRFMRCNLNGGDSFAYYYHRDCPTYLYNFKGEPAVKIALLDPEYYDNTAKPFSQKLAEKSEQSFVFHDKLTDKWWVGRRKEEEILEQPVTTSSMDKIENYFLFNGGLVPDPIPVWERVFDPTLEKQWLPEQKKFNTWRPSKYMKQATHRTLIPTTIMKILRHVLGGDAETEKHFINWLAYIYQTRHKSGMAWILHGCPGTGKGLLVHSILAPLFGREYLTSKQLRDLNSRFNGWMEQAIFVNIDEGSLNEGNFETKPVVEALKLWITESHLTIEAKNANSHMTQSFCNFIFTTNDFGGLPIQNEDRRFSVGTRQTVPIEITADEVAGIKDELLQFAGYLSAFEVDHVAAHATLDNDAKRALREAARVAPNEFVDAVEDGNFEYFHESKDEVIQDLQITDNFRKWIDRCIEDIKADRPSVVTAAELRDAYVMLVSGRPMVLSKFRSFMQKKGCPQTRFRQDNERHRGWLINWEVDPKFKASLKAHLKVVKSEEQIKKEIENELKA